MKFLFRPLAASAAKHVWFARRLASRIWYSKSLSGRQVFDGYLFLGKRALRDTVRVVVIDPPARWLVPGWNLLGLVESPYATAVSGLNRDYTSTAIDWAAPTATVIDGETSRQWGTYRVTFYQASFGNSVYHATCRSDWYGDYAIVPTFVTDVVGSNLPWATNYDPDMEFFLIAPVISWRLGTSPIESQGSVSLDGQMSFGLSETAVRVGFGVPSFRYAQNPQVWPESRVAMMGIPEVVDGFDRYTVVTNCVKQTGDNVDSGFMVARFQASRQLDDANLRQASALWANVQTLSVNTDSELRPQTDVATGVYRRNVLYDIGLLETDSAVFVVASSTIEWVEAPATAKITTATQVYNFDRATGAATVALDYKATISDPAVEQRRVTHCLNQVRYTATGVRKHSLAAVQFQITDEVVDGTIDLVFYDETGTRLVTGLRTAGYVPFWPKLHGAYTGWSYADDLQYQAAPQPSVVRAIGPDRIGVVAAPAAQVAAGGAVDWSLVVLDANTLDVISTRGVIATVPDSTVIGAYFTVLSDEIIDESGVVITPAVLVGFENNSTGYTHKLSRDGGTTWQTIFTGANWPLVYTGNGLHPVSFR